MAVKSLSLKDYYPWYRKGVECYPWERQYLNWEFLSYEEKRIKELQSWYKQFLKAPQNSKLESASFYVVPLEISSSWKGAIADFGNLKYIGLSALFNSSQVLVVGILPFTCKKPLDYSLIEVKDSRKFILYNRKNYRTLSVILIEDWIPLKSDKIYIDVPFEKRFVKKILYETLVHDNNLSQCFQAPIMSAPHIQGSIGGISLSSLSHNSNFVGELIKMIQLFVPPEYRTLSPPPRVYKGYKFKYDDDIIFNLAERPKNYDNILSGIYSKGYKKLDNELMVRKNFTGEYSIFSSIVTESGSESQLRKILLNKFSDTEACIPQDLDELIFADIDLTLLKNMMDENLWIQVFNARQVRPSFNNEEEKELSNSILTFKKDFDTLLSDVLKKETDRSYFISNYLTKNHNNLIRLAQSFARADENNNLDKKYLKQARDLIIDNFTGFIYDTKFSSSLLDLGNKKHTVDSRYQILQTELLSNPTLTVKEIFENVKSTNMFDDIYQLQDYMDWLHGKGYVIVDGNRRYTWI